ncbi:rhodanese-like domain-containing protein [Blastopirellula sp. JC732]|uniref:Rhodanese-like domain-containing protein n=1 Tax=Blastopirellula sediminis TaxID=2894196 RepID=A0A9X1SGZ3_9BACT|nr:rhodanese-like domain-containing protein [Blastopirellula sediminis]MCC9607190.1 rhodanese-like domain-containing protein [Blastopirellula sediminis]MCC9629517.1 rhodanese-like domain-containing protein [Blastopirellula sediminis]
MRVIAISLVAIGGLLVAGLLVSLSISPSEAPAAELANPLIDYDGFAKEAEVVRGIRENRRVSEDQFIEMAKDPQTVVLDCRSAEKYKLLHVKGAVSLPFSEITAEALAKVIPTKETRVLIYCNNNFENAPEAFAFKRPVASLNLHTYNQLHNYGYTNVYELKPLLDRHATKIEFAGLEVEVEKYRPEQPRSLLALQPSGGFGDASLENPRIDVDGFLKEVKLVQEIRELRRVSEDDFIRMSHDPETVILDARSVEKYKLLHARRAVNLTFPDVTEEALAKVIPTKDTRVLIYCNNNFKNAPVAFGPKGFRASLNIHTFIVLHNYGYTNVYELKPLLDRETTKIQFEGTEVDAAK